MEVKEKRVGEVSWRTFGWCVYSAQLSPYAVTIMVSFNNRVPTEEENVVTRKSV